MRPLERVPAVRRIETDRSDVFAVEITDEFTSADAENLCGLLEGAYALHPRIDLLVRLRELVNVDLIDLDQDTLALLRAHTHDNIGNCAVVGDATWRRAVESLFSFGSATTLRHFDTNDEDDAWDWLSAREIPENV